MRIRRATLGDQPAIERLNRRLSAGGASWTVYGPDVEERPAAAISSRLFVAADEAEVRGAVWLREHDFCLRGASLRAGWAKYPVAESLVDPSYGGVAGAMIFRLLREQPRLMALGMGGSGGAFAKLLRGMGWVGSDVPFLFSLERPARVLRHLRYVRRSALRRALLDAAAFSGLGWLGWQAIVAARRLLAPHVGAARAEEVASFGEWADSIWERTRSTYDLIARRDSAMLAEVYPPQMPVTRLRIRRGAEDIGWACVVRRELTEADDTPFGPLRIGLIADGLAAPSDAAAVVGAAKTFLRALSVDLLFSNQAHPAWIAALRANGFLEGPSRFALYRSPKLADIASEGMHINRGDCDGPIFW